MALEFDPDKHRYLLDGERCPSVTEVISVLAKEGLEWWSYGLAISGVLAVLRQCTVDPDQPDCEELIKRALNVMRKSPHAVVQDAATRGIAVHAAFVTFSETGCLEAKNGSAGYVESMRAFVDLFKPRIIAVEQKLHSPSLRVAGTYDALLEIDGQLVLCDWKTSKKIYPAHHLQGAAYEGMRRELGQKPATPMVVRLDRDGGVPEFVQARASFSDFKAAHVLWQARKRLSKKETVNAS
jgi:hypothetical protein